MCEQYKNVLSDLTRCDSNTVVSVTGLSVLSLTVTVSSVNPNTRRTAYGNSPFVGCYAALTGKQFSCTALP